MQEEKIETKRKNQWFDVVAADLADYGLSDANIERIASDYELMAESARLAEKYGINFLAIGSTDIPGSNQRYRHGSLTGHWGNIAHDIAISMLNDWQIREAVLMGVKLYRKYKKTLEAEGGEK